MAKIFEHFLNRDLAHVIRFNNRPQHFPESVAEHSFYVAYFTLILCHLLEKKRIKVDAKKALAMALVHDAEESFSGDILNPFKHFNEKVYQAIRDVNRQMVGEMFADLPTDLSSELVQLWKTENESKSIEAQIVKVADKLQLLSKCFEEIQAGNTYFEEIYKEQLSLLKKLDQPWWSKIRDDVLAGAAKQV
ncbi:MAG TPA: YfbR-like 5'-deoxynucleotidase [Candidatus Nanoarchaeia archaeon]